MKAICASVNFDVFMELSLPRNGSVNGIFQFRTIRLAGSTSVLVLSGPGCEFIRGQAVGLVTFASTFRWKFDCLFQESFYDGSERPKLIDGHSDVQISMYCFVTERNQVSNVIGFIWRQVASGG